MRKIGYAEHRGRDAVFSYVHRLHSTPYPRFHAYVDERDGGFSLNLHLDQKQPSYEGADHAHSGEYEGPVVEREMSRLLGLIEELRKKPTTSSPSGTNPPKEKRSFWDVLWG